MKPTRKSAPQSKTQILDALNKLQASVDALLLHRNGRTKGHTPVIYQSGDWNPNGVITFTPNGFAKRPGKPRLARTRASIMLAGICKALDMPETMMASRLFPNVNLKKALACTRTLFKDYGEEIATEEEHTRRGFPFAMR